MAPDALVEDTGVEAWANRVGKALRRLERQEPTMALDISQILTADPATAHITVRYNGQRAPIPGDAVSFMVAIGSDFKVVEMGPGGMSCHCQEFQDAGRCQHIAAFELWLNS